MFNVLTITALILASISAVAPLVVPRYGSGLEPYATYHARYMALGCNTKHGTSFFNTCCHPLKAGQSLSSRPQECTPGTIPPPDNGGSGVDDCETIDPSPTPTSTPSHSAQGGGAGAPPPAQTPTPSPTAHGSLGGGLNEGGFATFFYQNGNAGACGKVHSDDDMICAMDQQRYGNSGNASPLCGKQVQITNKENGKTITVTVADDCPTCVNSNSIDLSKGAFEKLAPLSEGTFPIEWKFLD